MVRKSAANAALPLYVMLGLTSALFAVQLALSHVTHALTLLVDSYHMLCNLIALSGCIITIKKGIGGGSPPVRSSHGSAPAAPGAPTTDDNSTEHSTLRGVAPPSAADRRLRNTFGWARIDVLVSLIGTVFLASLCFSLLVEALQTLVHIDHHDEMHEPLYVAGAGVASLAVNALCYALLGGYTFHQGSFFHVTENGDVVLEPAVTQDSVKLGERRLSAQRRVPPRTSHQFRQRQRQGCREMLRDTVGCVFVIAAALTVYFTDQSVGKYADPIMSIVSAVVLLVLSYPYMKEAGLILLQTIPEHINIKQLRSDFQQAFPGITDIHDLHVWRLNQSKVFCTAHVRFRDARDYLRVNQDVTRFFLEYGVTQVTVQPEFSSDGHAGAGAGAGCLMRCPGESCLRAHCCAPAAPDPQHYVRVASDLSLPEAPAGPRARTAATAATVVGKLPDEPKAATATTAATAATAATCTEARTAAVADLAPSRTPPAPGPPGPSERLDVVVELNAAVPAVPGAATSASTPPVEDVSPARARAGAAMPPDLPTSTSPPNAEQAPSSEAGGRTASGGLADDKSKQD